MDTQTDTQTKPLHNSLTMAQLALHEKVVEWERKADAATMPEHKEACKSIAEGYLRDVNRLAILKEAIDVA